jgi:hypothetical protein
MVKMPKTGFEMVTPNFFNPLSTTSVNSLFHLRRLSCR